MLVEVEVVVVDDVLDVVFVSISVVVVADVVVVDANDSCKIVVWDTRSTRRCDRRARSGGQWMCGSGVPCCAVHVDASVRQDCAWPRAPSTIHWHMAL